jgi:hypothetical protein
MYLLKINLPPLFSDYYFVNCKDILKFIIMKKLILLIAIAFLAITVFAQPLKKGNLVGVHVVTVELKPDVTIDQFKDFFVNKYLPEINKTDPNWQIFLAEGIRGENVNQIGLIHVIKSAKDRDKYYNQDGSENKKMVEQRMKKIQPFTDEIGKLGSITTKYTDWVIK